MHATVKPRLLAFLAIAAIAAPALLLRGAAQATPASRAAFAKRVVTTGLEDPFQVVWGPDDYLWVTERTAGRVTRVLPTNGSTTPAIVINDLLTDGPGGLLGMALDPGLLKGTGNDYVYVAYTYDADADPAKVAGRMKRPRSGCSRSCPDSGASSLRRSLMKTNPTMLSRFSLYTGIREYSCSRKRARSSS